MKKRKENQENSEKKNEGIIINFLGCGNDATIM